MSRVNLPLDSAALDRLENKDLDRVRESAYQDLIEQGRAALVLRDELASRSRASAHHTTHFDDCGCQSDALNALLDKQRAEFAAETDRQEARIATLEAALLARHGGEALALLDELTTERAKVATLEAELAIVTRYHESLSGWQAHANSLRDALENAAVTLRKNDLPHHAQAIVNILAQTPAASLAALKAEVLERAARAQVADIERQAIARARAEGAASERGECDEAVQSVPTPPEWRDLLGDWRGQAFNAGLIAASDAIRARGERFPLSGADAPSEGGKA